MCAVLEPRNIDDGIDMTQNLRQKAAPPSSPASPASPAAAALRAALDAYLARGALNLAIAWALALSFFAVFPPFLAARWDALLALFPSDLWRFVGIVWGANAAATLLGNLAFAALYAGDFAWAERHKIGAAPWPWRAREPAARAAFWAALPRSLLIVAGNNAFLIVMLVVPYALHARHLGAFSLAREELPASRLSLVAQLAFCFACEDAVFYAVHRALHDPRVFRLVHRMHHEWRAPIVLASEHAHVLEYVISNGVPVIVGPLLLRAHTFTVAIFVLVRVATSVDNHCGFAFPWSPVRLLPFGATAESHDFHHSSVSTGVFSSQFALLDALFETFGAFPEWRRRRTAAVLAARSGANEAAR